MRQPCVNAARFVGTGRVPSQSEAVLAPGGPILARISTLALETWARMQGATPQGYVPGTRFPAAFAHIVNGYAAGYYGYMWSEVIALDMLSAFEGRMLDPAVGKRYRNAILARGGEAPPAQLVENFLGRKANRDAFFKELAGTR